MNFLLENWYLVLMASVSLTLLLLPLMKEKKLSVNVATAVQLINRERAVLIDINNPEAFNLVRAKGAKNLPLEDVSTKLTALVKKKETPIVFICALGNRSAKAVAQATKLGYGAAYHLTGGLKAWQESNMPIEKS